MSEDKESVNNEPKNRKPRAEKTIKQKIASAQMRLNRLKTKDKALTKQAETRQKIILGAEVAKAVGCDVFDIDKELVLGFLLALPQLSEADAMKCKKKGRAFLLEMIGRQT
ncbi:conjugal transfer protein TraD [Serratia nevei]|uniref:conjugal transfer protein TraD n=1 Tax=Serratia nevei TaxID=2703794 RepID=UPI00313F3C54|nr:conjugal transfer protein TraD [Pluralibacter gergoviae]